MKACLMKVNYSPQYVKPHQHEHKPYESLQVRLESIKDTYQACLAPDKILRRSLAQGASRDATKAKDDVQSQVTKSSVLKNNKNAALIPVADKTKSPVKSNKGKYETFDPHREGVENAHRSLRHQLPGKAGQDQLSFSMSWCHLKPQYSTLGPYADKMKRSQTHYQQTFQVFPPTRKSTQLYSSKTSENLTRNSQPISRRTTSDTCITLSKLIKSPSVLEQERRARLEADKAIKSRKVFTIQGPYHTLRLALRRRGWVEKFDKVPPSEGGRSNEDDDRENSVWEEENGYFRILSHMVRNCTATFVFTLKSTIGQLRSDQLVNHFGKARHFTTKIGLCQSLRTLPWYVPVDADTFYPRCYSLDEAEDREAFIDDYRITACISFIHYFIKKYENKTETKENNESEARKISTGSLPNSERSESSRKSTESTNARFFRSVSQPQPLSDLTVALNVPITVNPYNVVKPKSHPRVNIDALGVAITECERLLTEREHEDIDNLHEKIMDYNQWGKFIINFYQFVHEDGEIVGVESGMVERCRDVLTRVRQVCPQSTIDGWQNTWILKPGAKSRGRGIECHEKLEVMLSAADSLGSNYVLQKYIEQPYLIHKTKFDIRQWFLVTDWNPVTLWFYKHSYLRFCSQEFTLNNLHSSIHLSNNTIQRHYTSYSGRCHELPDDNTWTSDQFKEYLQSVGQGEVWGKVIVPGMKQAIISTLLCTQEYIEPRKSAFELYGADFMLSEDFKPWLLEINSSPSMARTTKATAKLVAHVLEDTLKVVLDRKEDRGADTGDFELAFRQAQICDPPSSDLSLAVQGKKLKKRGVKR